MALTTIDTYGIKDGAVQIDDIGTLAGNLTINDSGKLRLGTGLDLQLYHDGSNSYITEASGSTPGDLLIQANNIKLRNWDGGQTYLHGTSSGSVDLYHDGNKKFETTATGVKVTGKLRLDDSQNIELGDSQDLMIYHSGSSSWIYDNGTGDLNIGSNGSTINMAVGSSANEIAAKFISDGAVELYNNNGLALKTDQYGIIVTAPTTSNASTVLIKGFEAKDAQILFQADEADDNADIYKILGSTDGSFYIQNLSNGSSYETNIKTTGAAGVELYYDNSKKFETTSGGAKFIGNLYGDDEAELRLGNSGDLQIFHNASSGVNHIYGASNCPIIFSTNTAERCRITSGGDLNFENDSSKITLGTGQDLQIYHDGSHSYIKDAGTGHLYIASSAVYIMNPANNEYLGAFAENGSSALYYDNSNKLETTSSGINITGNIVQGSNNYIDMGGGDLYTDDDGKIRLGTGDDVHFYFDGTHLRLHNPSGGNFSCKSKAYYFNDELGLENCLDVISDGAVNLYYDNVKKLETTSSSIQVHGHVDVQSTGSVYLQDNGKVQLGTSQDLKIYHESSSTTNWIEAANGDTKIQCTDGDIYLNPKAGEVGVKVITDGSVELYYNNILTCYTGNGALQLPDNIAIFFGAGNDLQISHDGNNSWIKDAGTGALVLANSSGGVQNAAATENIIWWSENGNVELFYDNSKKLGTASWGTQIFGNLQLDDSDILKLGNAGDLAIYHNGSHSRIDNSTGNLYINAASGETGISVIANGSIDLYYDNSKKFETISTGVKVNGSKIEVINTAAAGDAQLYLEAGEGGTAYIQFIADNGDDNTDKSRILQSDGANLKIQNYDSGSWATKLETTSTGVTVTGGLTATEDCFIGGTSNEDQERFLVKSADSPNCYFYTTTSSDVVNVVMKHARVVSGSTGYQVMFKRNDGTNVGSITSTYTATAYNTSSDYRLKENQVAISDGITRIKQLKAYRFNFKEEPGKTVDGFFAHEVTPTVPEAVTGEKDGTEMQGIDQSKLVPLLTAALQEAITKIEALEVKTAAL